MLIQPINNQYNQIFGIKYKLSKETIRAAERTTGLTYEEMTTLPFQEARKLMKERGTLKEPSRLKVWLSDAYKKFGETIGLLKKEPYIYTDLH